MPSSNFIIANTAANGGNAAKRWRAVQAALQRSGFDFQSGESQTLEQGKAVLEQALESGAECIIAAGGDGTLNAVLNELIDSQTDTLKSDVILGAIGLGSSNDFQKPFEEGQNLAGCPSRIAKDRARHVDIGKAVYIDEFDKEQTSYFLLNGSVGFVAEGNAFFNTSDAVSFLKRFHVEVAIIYTALANLMQFEPIKVKLKVDDDFEKELKLASVSVLNKRHLAGGMYYDTPVEMDDGFFDINFWGDMNRAEIFKTLVNLYQGKFLGKPKTDHMRGKHVEIVPAKPSHLELDGEVRLIKRAELSVLPKFIRLCG